MHEQSETIQLPDGRWVNVYGSALPKRGQQLPGTPSYPTVKEAVAAAVARSEKHGHDQQPEKSMDNEREEQKSPRQRPRLGEIREPRITGARYGLNQGGDPDAFPRQQSFDIHGGGPSAEQLAAYANPPEPALRTAQPRIPTDALAAGLAAQGAGAHNLGRGIGNPPDAAEYDLRKKLREQSAIANIMRSAKGYQNIDPAYPSY